MRDHVTFIVPAYNCAYTIKDSIYSILSGNFRPDDEIVIVDDCSSDETADVLRELAKENSGIRVITHLRNKGGGAARNTAVEYAKNEILFCLDSDNILIPYSVGKLIRQLIKDNLSCVAFGEVSFFRESVNHITHKWVYEHHSYGLPEVLSTSKVPGSSGNYLFTKESWRRAGGYPEFAGALDAWGFGLRQAATGTRLTILPGTTYLHRYGHESYWVRDTRRVTQSIVALQILLPFIDQIENEDVDYFMGSPGRYSWFENLENHPLKVKSQNRVIASSGRTSPLERLKLRIKSGASQLFSNHSWRR